MSRALPSRVSLVGLAGFLVVVALVPWVAPNAYVVQVLAFTGLNVMLAVGLNLLMGYAGQVSLGHAGFYGLGAYVSSVLGVRFGLSPWLGMPAAACVTALLAYAIGAPTLKLKSYYLAMATLGIGIVLHLGFVQLYWWTGGSSGLANIPPLDIGPLHFGSDRAHYYAIWLFAAAALWLALNLVNSSVGRALRAVGDSEVAASAMGVDAPWAKRRIFVLSAVYASVAGSLYAHYITVISPEIFSFLASVVLVLMVAIGGIGQYWGPVLGALLLTLLPEYLRKYGDYEVPLYGLALIVVMLFLPRGLAGLLQRGARRGAIGSRGRQPRRGVAATVGAAPLLEVQGSEQSTSAASERCRPARSTSGPAEIRAVIGPNGAGKTTLFNVITGVYPPTQGEVRFQGQRLTGLPPHEVARLGVSPDVPERAALRQPLGRRERDGRRRRPSPPIASWTRPGPAAPRPRPIAIAWRGRSAVSPWSASSPSPSHPRRACRSASRSSSRSRARWPVSRRCCCSTSRPPA